MYVRVKRHKTTVFLHCDPIDTIAQIKERINQVMNIGVDQQKLFRTEQGDEELANDITLEDLKIENGASVYLVCFNEETQSWESINIPKPSMDDEEEVEEAEEGEEEAEEED